MCFRLRMDSWGYFLVFLLAFLVDLIPFAGPPAWTVMVFCLVVFKLQIWPVLVLGVIASTLGRYLMSRFIFRVSGRFLEEEKTQDLAFIGHKLEAHGWKSRLFIFLYTLTPLSTTALFTAIGMARVSAAKALPAFFAGKLISDWLILEASDYVAQDPKAALQSLFSPQFIFYTVLGLLLVAFLLFADWRLLLEKKELRFKFNILK
ncbi:hypothetical protein I5M27_09610 [Adhaeribacter sp. BT258]|uniref:Membrane protein DedA, SNARE-associated domain n=1 Tax=Adhaeribacter terrigena TaxID=2793070 RepID=A0ABS1C1F9_9BACT|nr:hypothetical protein [Adhaeribacter terrigena]MBK0403241.1 hypothetical protein [Adhaeribacter terrigena]